jgi:hypothetical protein
LTGVLGSPWLYALPEDDFSNIGISLPLQNVPDKLSGYGGITRACSLVHLLATSKISGQISRRDAPYFDTVFFEDTVPLSAKSSQSA